MLLQDNLTYINTLVSLNECGRSTLANEQGDTYRKITSYQCSYMSNDVNMSTLCTKEQLHWCYMALQNKFNEEKSKHTGFGSGKWFWPCVLDMMLRLVKGMAKSNTCC